MRTDSLKEMEVGQRPGQPEVQNVSKKSPDLKLLVIFPCPRNGGGQAVSGVMEKHVSYTFQQLLFNPQVSRPLDMMGAETVVNKVHSGLSKIATNTQMAHIALKSEITSQTECDASLLLSHTGQLDEKRDISRPSAAF